MSTARQALEKKARNAILQEAFFRLRSASILGASLVFGTLGGIFNIFAGLGILFLGLVLWLASGFETLRNPKINAKAVAHIFEKEFKPPQVSSQTLNRQMKQAVEYLQQIEEAVNKTKEGVLRDRLKRTSDEVVDWVQAIYRLATRLDDYSKDEIIKRDLEAVPGTIKQLRQRLRTEDSPPIINQLEKTITDKERQLENLERLQNTMENAELQLQQTLSALGTVYSQLLLVDNQGASSGRAARLQEEISEQVHQLQDITEAMEEYYAH